jgi:acetate kinase
VAKGRWDFLSIRGLSSQGLSEMGIDMDDLVNRGIFLSPRDELVDISTHDSSVQVLIIPTDEGG